MGGEGTMSSMISSLKNNRNLLKQKRTRFNSNSIEVQLPHKELRFKRVSKVKLERLKRQYKQQKERDRQKLFFALFASLVLGSGIIFAIADLLN